MTNEEWIMAYMNADDDGQLVAEIDENCPNFPKQKPDEKREIPLSANAYEELMTIFLGDDEINPEVVTKGWNDDERADETA